VRSEREIVDVLHEGQLMLVFSVGREVQAMATAVEQLTREQEEDVVVRPARMGHGR
jgi:glycerate-2-kinase